MHVGDGVCAGVAPVTERGDCWNVTVVADADRFGHEARDPRALFRRVLSQLPGLAQLEIEPGELLASGPFDRPVTRPTFPGAALVGDAAGYFDPFTGQGIYQAMAGAEQLARVLLPLLRRAVRSSPGVRELEPYAAAHAALTRGPRRVQHLVHRVLDRPRLAELAISGLARRPRAAAALLAVTGDVRPAGSLLSPALAVSLLFPRPAA
jgi:flavin-dependent dehydrogenase